MIMFEIIIYVVVGIRFGLEVIVRVLLFIFFFDCLFRDKLGFDMIIFSLCCMNVIINVFLDVLKLLVGGIWILRFKGYCLVLVNGLSCIFEMLYMF